jgi:hypothetical protein
MPIKLFQSGEVAYASDVNTYLMDQVIAVFADAAARDAAFGGANEPTLSAGRFCFLLDTLEVQYYTGTQWQSSSQFTIEDDAITTAKIADDAVTTAKIADNAVTTAIIATSAVTEAKIGTGAVTEAKLGTGAVTEAKIGAGAVTEAKIGSAAVTADKIGSSAVIEAKINTGAVTETKIGTGAVTTAKIADDAVTTAKIADDAVTTAKIADDAVETAQIAANAVTNAEFRQSSGLSVVGNATNASANVADITSSTDGSVLRRNGTALEFAKIANTNIDDSASISSTKLGPVSVTAHAGASNSTISASYANQIITISSATAFNLGLVASDVSYPIGTTITFVQLGAGKVTFISHAGAATLISPIASAYSCRAQYSVVSAIKIASETWLLAGDLST